MFGALELNCQEQVPSHAFVFLVEKGRVLLLKSRVRCFGKRLDVPETFPLLGDGMAERDSVFGLHAASFAVLRRAARMAQR